MLQLRVHHFCCMLVRVPVVDDLVRTSDVETSLILMPCCTPKLPLLGGAMVKLLLTINITTYAHNSV